jgi:hypothetical protein
MGATPDPDKPNASPPAGTASASFYWATNSFCRFAWHHRFLSCRFAFSAQWAAMASIIAPSGYRMVEKDDALSED